MHMREINFFQQHTGKREKPPDAMQMLAAESPANRMTRQGRGMIYVHSKVQSRLAMIT
jgi:hypothetical protein